MPANIDNPHFLESRVQPIGLDETERDGRFYLRNSLGTIGNRQASYLHHLQIVGAVGVAADDDLFVMYGSRV